MQTRVILRPGERGTKKMFSVLSACEDLHKYSVKTRTAINLTRAFIAIHLFRRDMGLWPDTLAELRSKSLRPDELIDLFSGTPLQYSREKGILWSVAADGKNDNGDSEMDFVINIPNQASDATSEPTPSAVSLSHQR